MNSMLLSALTAIHSESLCYQICCPLMAKQWKAGFSLNFCDQEATSVSPSISVLQAKDHETNSPAAVCMYILNVHLQPNKLYLFCTTYLEEKKHLQVKQHFSVNYFY